MASARRQDDELSERRAPEGRCNAQTWAPRSKIDGLVGGPQVVRDVEGAKSSPGPPHRRGHAAPVDRAPAVIVSNLEDASSTGLRDDSCAARVRGGGARSDQVLLDGGIRAATTSPGAAMGARAMLIGRAYAYGLGAGGGRRHARHSNPPRRPHPRDETARLRLVRDLEGRSDRAGSVDARAERAT